MSTYKSDSVPGKVIVTGGCGYIGSHTIVELLAAGFEVVSIDSNVRSDISILDGVERLTGKRVMNYPVDLRDSTAADKVFSAHRDAGAVIHFAGFKTVSESVAFPERYYQNNLGSLLSVMRAVGQYRIPRLVFSSSCSVYGNPVHLPVAEETAFGEAQSPYARTKQIGEALIRDCAGSGSTRFVSLRYFNPAGAHPSLEIGEVPFGKPENLVPAITRSALGRLPELVVRGTNYPTRDGSCVRDYIHVSDIARAHVQALEYLDRSGAQHDVFNLGLGNGVTVLELLRAFERATGVRLKFRLGSRRPGDVSAVYAGRAKAEQLLGWQPRFSIDDMMRTAWAWELKRMQAETAQVRVVVPDAERVAQLTPLTKAT
jgi:UDP-glucose 4-epimerase